MNRPPGIRVLPLRLRGLGWSSTLLVMLLIFAPITGVAQSTPEATPKSGTLAAYAWTQLTADGNLVVRSITDGDCPTADIDGVSVPMTTRGERSTAFPVQVCEGAVPPGAGAITVAGQALTGLAPSPRRIAVIGDTGCRAETGDPFQSCNDPNAWPFAQIAQAVADYQPDLIIHVGDYLYREVPCPAGNAGCAGSPAGDNWPTWEADFFAPAAPALTAAPWLFIRGNHEVCARAGDGWFRFLDPRAYAAACADYTAPFALDLGTQRVVILDSAIAADEVSTPAETEMFQGEFAKIESLTGESAWLVTHKPVWGIIENQRGRQIEVDTETFAAATGDNLPPAIDVLLAGHLHLAEILDFAENSGRPTQFIVGNSGTELDRNLTSSLTGMELDDERLAYAETIERFGFMTLEQVDVGWVATERGINGAAGISCLLMGKSAYCGVVFNE